MFWSFITLLCGSFLSWIHFLGILQINECKLRVCSELWDWKVVRWHVICPFWKPQWYFCWFPRSLGNADPAPGRSKPLVLRSLLPGYMFFVILHPTKMQFCAFRCFRREMNGMDFPTRCWGQLGWSELPVRVLLMDACGWTMLWQGRGCKETLNKLC